MCKYMTREIIEKTNAAADFDGFIAARTILESEGVKADTIVPCNLFNDVMQMLPKLYNPADKGRAGKVGEVDERVNRWQESGRLWAHWSEFHARKTGRADIGNNTEMKTGCGDWLYSYKGSTCEEIFEEYYHKSGKIRWATDDFIIECSWIDFLDYLASYNNKGLATWFKSTTKYNPMLSRTVVLMQEYKTSKKKLAYLQDCPYCV